VLVESGGDNLAASFSPELVDLCIYVIDVAAGDKIPRQGRVLALPAPDLLVINKIDLASMVGANLEVMQRDTERMRGGRPWCFTNLRSGEGLEAGRGLSVAPTTEIPSLIMTNKCWKRDLCLERALSPC